MFKVLIPVDGSACSERAVSQFITHTAWFRETPEIHLLHVHASLPIGRGQKHIDHETLERHYREEGEAQQASAQALLNTAALPFLPHMHVGQAAEAIVKLARELACDIIFMGTHGRGALPAAVLGSAASKVPHLADRPVMLAQ